MGTILLTRQYQWMTFGFHYALHIIPFAFIALTFGLSRIAGWVGRWREPVLWILCAALILLNIGNYSIFPVTAEDNKTRRLAESLAREDTCIPMGHLLPYVGYRPDNCYLSPVVQKGHQKAFQEAEWVLMAREVNPYPLTPEELASEIANYRKDPSRTPAVDDGIRMLFKRKG